MPGPAVAEQLNKITLANIIGPVAVGKTTCLNYISTHSTEFGRVQSFTTRPRREDDPEEDYRYLEHSQQTIVTIAQKVRSAELVQYAVHPTTGYIYGSVVSDYYRPYMMLAALADSISGLRRLPFKEVKGLCLITEPEEWLRRFAGRNNKVDSQKRLVEGINSLEWCLDQGDSLPWVCNPAGMGRLADVCQEIQLIIKGNIQPSRSARDLGEKLLATMIETVEL